MARGDCQREFEEAAAEDGVVFTKQSFSWLCQRGHLELPDDVAQAREVLERIYVQLGGNLEELAAAPPTRLSGDFLHEPTGTLVEIDEQQHFTTARLRTLRLYPDHQPLGFELDEYIALCRRHQRQADRAFAHRAARGFGAGGRQQQRAYYDALRDLVTPAMGHPPLIRIEAPHDNGRAAYQNHRERLLRALVDSSSF
jgi:hypothetical protein